ncbi:unnamed protein product [Protopolystoma xenopodis]|uniref:Uncharacterized protein n=1 Tax=Protopolystoma xenopodis TaxID=117903 RepID=A0A3S5AC51_9PLAT|nr:unnamed protein product [Protopolystoma xenopodis]
MHLGFIMNELATEACSEYEHRSDGLPSSLQEGLSTTDHTTTGLEELGVAELDEDEEDLSGDLLSPALTAVTTADSVGLGVPVSGVTLVHSGTNRRKSPVRPMQVLQTGKAAPATR